MHCGFKFPTRREWLRWTAGTAAAAAISRPAFSATGQSEKPGRRPPYAALEPFIEPGFDEFAGEKAVEECKAALNRAFLSSEPLPLTPAAKGISPYPTRYDSAGPEVAVAVFSEIDTDVQSGWAKWRNSLGSIRRSQFYFLPDNLVRYEVASASDHGLAYHVGFWKIVWDGPKIQSLYPLEEQVATAPEPWFRDVTAHALHGQPDLLKQFGCGIPHWRSRLDPASGIDVYGSNGIAVGDIDGDGFDEVYICQPGGLPNRLLKIAIDGVVADLTEAWGVGLLDDTSSALFLDLRNTGRQDLVVLRSSGPLLFLHEGNRYRLRTDAFQFGSVPAGNFTGMASADYDRDGKLDLYLCCYVYFQSEAQYTYASPYHDAQNGPPNFLFRNRLNADGSGFFEDTTESSGIGENNNRFSFAPAWCDYNEDGWPDLYVANDFGKKNLYLNREGKFKDIAADAGVEDIGPGMSASWFDYDGDGRPDLYVANMWTETGQRIIHDPQFKPGEAEPGAYRKHTMGNSLFQNRGDGVFDDVTRRERAAFGRWAWASSGHDLDNDGQPELFVTCGMLTNRSETDLDGFFWREVVARSPVRPGRSSAYERGWNAINQFVREDYSWSGHEPNVLHARRGGRYFDFSGVSGLDCADDGRAFAIVDFDGDGWPDILLKSRLGPQIRLLQNNRANARPALAIRLQGTESNRDAIGAKVRVAGQSKWVEAGSGFLSQHTKRLIFALKDDTMDAEVIWPSGKKQTFSHLEAGYTYSFTEGEAHFARQPFRTHARLPEGALPAENSMRMDDTWFSDPVPLPSPQPCPGLFVVREWSDEYAIFRRYLFDWRTSLETPLALLLNSRGEVVRVYANIPSAERVRADLLVTKPPVLPFRGFYVKQPRRDFFKFGGAYLWAGMPQKALPYLKRVLDQNPANARVLVLVGQVHLESDHLDAAADAFRRAIQSDPASANAWIGLGDVAARTGHDSDAQAHYSKALDIDPQSAEAANALGLVLAKGGQLAKAQSYFEQAIAQQRDYADAINNLAVLYSKEGKMNDAIAAWTYGIQVAPAEDMLYLNLGRAYVSSGQFDKARFIMQRLLDRDGGNEIARRALQELSAR